MAGSAGHFQRALVVLTSMNLLANIAFQLVLIFAFPPYGHLVEPKCGSLEKILRHVGFIRLDNLPLWGYVTYIGPEVVVLIVSILVYSICSKLNPSSLLNNELLPVSEPHPHVSHSSAASQRRIAIFTIFGKYICLLMMCLAGVLRPSLLSAIYYVSFLSAMTAWACNSDLGRHFARYCRFLMIVLLAHISALFVYQTQWAQEILPPRSPIPRYLGLTALLLTSCDKDPRVCEMNPLEWPSFVNPLVLTMLYFMLCFEADAILNAPESSSLDPQQNNEALTESTPLIRGRESIYRKTPPRKGIVQDARGSLTVTEMSEEETKSESPEGDFLRNEAKGERIPLQEIKKSISIPGYLQRKSEVSSGVLDVIISAGLTIAQLLAQSSYIGTNIIMMTWSITYHSWLTFVLLLWGSIMWLVPNQRRAMLRSSPFLVIYAVVLLLAQYIYGMDLTDQELPQTIQGLNLKQIGFEKVTHLACKPLIIKTCFTLMFWITLKQYVIEKQEARNQSALADIAAPLHIGVGTATEPVSGMGDESQTKTNQLVQRIGNLCRSLLTKFWIWIVASILFTIGISGERMTIFRIIYMALALIFILTFQISWSLWRKIMYGFWLTVIIYSMLILVMTYTYQFDHFDEYWDKYLKIDKELQKDIGLERFDTANLFVKLLTPTFFVIITVIQLYYFHKDFLAISDIKSRGTSSVRRVRATSIAVEEDGMPHSLPSGDSPSLGPSSNYAESIMPDKMRKKSFHLRESPSSNYTDSILTEKTEKRRKSYHIRETLKRLTWTSITHSISKACRYVIELIWLFLELHVLKIVMFVIVMVAIQDVCALHMLFVLITVISMMLPTNLQIILSHAMSIYASVVLLAKMIYQIEYIDHSQFNVHCQEDNTTYNTAEWAGFEKTDSGHSLPALLSGYIGVILIVTFHAVVMTRQKYQRHMKGRSLSRPLIMFPGITFVHADKNVIYSLKYLCNYVFYRFGVEICLISMIILTATRMDVYACGYALWVILLITPKRAVLSTVWPILTLFIAISIPFQYGIVVGLPPFLCFDYPWAGSTGNLESLREWLYLPDEISPPASYKLFCDFIVFLLVCRQGVVFRIERKHVDGSYAGGTNRSIIAEAENDNFINPTPDYISYTRSYLDVVKRIVLQTFLWVTLAIVFLAGSNRVNLFSVGYLIGAFIFLWQGNDLYLRPVTVILKWWHQLVVYNVSVIFFKTILQMLGCLYLKELQSYACWAVQLLGIACIKKFGARTGPRGAFDAELCEVYQGDVGLAWDGFCFAFLILQRRLFNSYYFFHIIDEAKAMSILASRGAELIEELSQKRMEEQQEAERKILEKIKNKMDRIKASQKKLQGPNYKEPENHHADETDGSQGKSFGQSKMRRAIRSGDYYMFDDFEEDLELISETSSSEDSDALIDKQRPRLTDLLSDLLKADMATAADKALEKEEKLTEKLDQRRASMPLPGPRHLQLSTKKSVVSLPDSPQKLARILEAREPQPSTSKELIGKDRSDASSESKRLRFHEGDEGDGVREQPSAESVQQPSIRTKIINFIKFLIAFINSLMVTVTVFLNKFSRDYRFVMKTLSIEKKQLKTNKSFGQGIRRGSNRMWEPLPVAIPSKIKSSPILEEQKERIKQFPMTNTISEESPMSIEDFEGSDELDTKNQPPFIRLLMAIWYAVFSHSELVCYFIIFLHQIRSPTILSLPLPLMVFLWGTLTVPRPSKTFWITIIAYTEVVVILKCLCQFELIPWNSKLIPDNAPFSLPRIIGVERQPGMYAYYDLLLLLVVFFHRSMLKSLGLWKVSTYSTGAKSSPASESTDLDFNSMRTDDESFRGKAGDMVRKDRDSYSEKGSLVKLSESEHHLDTKELPLKLKSRKFLWPFIKFFNILMRRTGKVTDDVYAYMFFCDFFNFLVVIFGFAAFGSSQGDGGVSQYFEENKVPIPFLVMLILQFGLIIVDRTLYLRKFILGKIIFQFLLVFGIHIWMFFVLPAVTQRSFNAALPPQMWYMVKCLYLLLSSYQIRVGYPTRILGNFLCKSYNYINMFLFKVFMAVPFVFELRALMDWIWTDTSMTLSDWLKMEDIFAHVFQLKCQRRAESEYPQPRGEKKANMTKYFMGGGSLFMVIAVIWFPLVLFALGNTVGEPNLPYEVEINVQLGSFQPIYKYTVRNDSISSITSDDWERFSQAYKKSRTAQTFLSNYEYEDVGVIAFDVHSSYMWTMSPPAVQNLIDHLNSSELVHVRFSWKMNRFTTNPEEPPVAENGIDYYMPPSDPARNSLVKALETNNTLAIEERIIFKNIMPKFIKVTSRGTANPIDQLMIYDDEAPASARQLGRNVTAKPTRTGNQWWWDCYEDCSDTTYENLLKHLPQNTCKDKIIIYTFNDKAFPATLNLISGKGIIGLYTTFVIVIHSVIRGFFTGISFKIMFDDMPNVDRLLQLCLDIYLVRESGDLDLEEDLFAKLVFLYRSPETLIKWTRPPEEINEDEQDAQPELND